MKPKQNSAQIYLQQMAAVCQTKALTTYLNAYKQQAYTHMYMYVCICTFGHDYFYSIKAFLSSKLFIKRVR